MADHPLKSAKDRRLGEPLPHQLANLTQAHLQAAAEATFKPKLSCGINDRFQSVSPTCRQIPTRYSPVRHSSASEDLLPFDLHVLSIPPAFNLSQNQTLQFFSIFALTTVLLNSYSLKECLYIIYL